MKLHLHKGSFQLVGVIQVPNVCEQPVPQGNGGVHGGSVARGERGAEKSVKAM
jgi:hypothetical protein